MENGSFWHPDSNIPTKTETGKALLVLSNKDRGRENGFALNIKKIAKLRLSRSIPEQTFKT